ncbi:YbjN domain-containing protein, partial [Streptomyces sp. GXMU-J5]|nr:YbjN domain-containing protein [Streptomyces beihaiensis]
RAAIEFDRWLVEQLGLEADVESAQDKGDEGDGAAE